MDTKTDFRARSYRGDADLQEIADLFNLIELHDKLDSGIVTPEELRTRFSDPNTIAERDLRLWEDAGGRLVGLGHIAIFPLDNEPFTDTRLDMRVHPEARNMGLEETLFSWAEQQVATVAHEHNRPGRIFAYLPYRSPEYTAYGKGVLDRNGYTPTRYWFRMARDLNAPIAEPQLPEGYTLRHTEGPAEADTWTDLFNLSFVDHWNHHDETPDSNRHFLETDPNYVKERDLVAIAPDGTWAAFCFLWINPEDNAVHNRKQGWIEVLGTRRGYRKLGLGTAMLNAGMLKLKSDGMDTAMLGVDAENPTGALKLYEAVGFRKGNSSATYEKVLKRNA